MGVAKPQTSVPEMPGEGGEWQQTGCSQVLIGKRSSQGGGRSTDGELIRESLFVNIAVRRLLRTRPWANR